MHTTPGPVRIFTILSFISNFLSTSKTKCWTGHYNVRTPIWAAAHMNQHTSIGMAFLKNGTGIGRLASGCGTVRSYYAFAQPIKKTHI
jgi:hypothetical protein